MIAPTPFFSDRGCHVRIFNEATALDKLGHKVVMATYHLGKTPAGITAERILNIPWYKKLEAGPSWHKLYLDILLTLKSLKVALEFKPDIIHGHLHEGALIGKVVSLAARRPLVFDYQGSLSNECLAHGFFKEKSFRHQAFKIAESFINTLPHRIVSSTPENMPCQARFIPDGVSLAPRRPPPQPTEPTVVYLGLLSQYQGTDILLEAAQKVVALLPQAKFIIGGFPNIGHYQKRALSLGLKKNLTFAGPIPFETRFDFLCRGKVAVAPKLAVSEANGKVLDYMAAGLPVVAFDTPINHCYLGNLGIYAKTGEAADLANKIAATLNRSPQDLAALGEKNRQRVKKHFSQAAMAKSLSKIYTKLLAKHHKTRKKPDRS